MLAVPSYQDYGVKAASVLPWVKGALARERPDALRRLQPRAIEVLSVLVAVHPRKLDRLEIANCLGRDGSAVENNNYVQPGISSFHQNGLMDTIVQRDDDHLPYTYGVNPDFLAAVEAVRIEASVVANPGEAIRSIGAIEAALVSNAFEEGALQAGDALVPSDTEAAAALVDEDVLAKEAVAALPFMAEASLQAPAKAPEINLDKTGPSDPLMSMLADLDFDPTRVTADDVEAMIIKATGGGEPSSEQILIAESTASPINQTKDQPTVSKKIENEPAAASDIEEAIRRELAVLAATPKPGSAAEQILKRVGDFDAVLDCGHSYDDIAATFVRTGFPDAKPGLVERLHRRSKA